MRLERESRRHAHQAVGAALAAFVLCAAAVANATPSVSIHWGGCPFPAHESENRNAGVGPIQTITVTATGLSGTITAVQVPIRFRTPSGGLADAWRFEDGGCEAGHLQYNVLSLGDPCPLFRGAHPAEFETFEILEAGIGARLVYAVLFDPIVADPTKTYTLARFDFDQSNTFGTPGTKPDSCGCAEQPMCIALNGAAYLDGSGVEFPISVSREYLNWNDPNNDLHCPGGGGDLVTTGLDSCGGPAPTPANARSWGSIKGMYRAPAR